MLPHRRVSRDRLRIVILQPMLPFTIFLFKLCPDYAFLLLIRERTSTTLITRTHTTDTRVLILLFRPKDHLPAQKAPLWYPTLLDTGLQEMVAIVRFLLIEVM